MTENTATGCNSRCETTDSNTLRQPAITADYVHNCKTLVQRFPNQLGLLRSPELLAFPLVERVRHLQEMVPFVPEGTLLHYIGSALSAISREEQLRRANIQQHDPETHDAMPEWLGLRQKSGSTTPNLYGIGEYKSSHQQKVSYVHPELENIGANPACIYGTLTEDEVEAVFVDWRTAAIGYESDTDGYVLSDVVIEHYGIICAKDCPIKQHSPDGVVVETWVHPETDHVKVTRSLAEYKSRWGMRDKWEHRKDPEEFDECDHDIEHRLRTEFGIRRLIDWKKIPLDLYPVKPVRRTSPLVILPVSSQYYGQVQNGMDIMGNEGFCDKTFTWFAVWVPACYHEQPWPAFQERPSGHKGTSITVSGRRGTIQVTRVPFNASFAADMDCTTTWMFINEVLVSKFWKTQGLLAPGALTPCHQLGDQCDGRAPSSAGTSSGLSGRVQRQIARKRAVAEYRLDRKLKKAQRRAPPTTAPVRSFNDFGFEVQRSTNEQIESDRRRRLQDFDGNPASTNDFGFALPPQKKRRTWDEAKDRPPTSHNDHLRHTE